MKKKITLVLIALITALSCACIFASCKKADDGKVKVVCTIFPEYDWVMNVVGEKVDSVSVTLLEDSGADLHSYQPSVADIAAIAEADVFLYVGGESDDWVKDILRSVKNKKMRALNLLELLGDRAVTEEFAEGMEREEEEEGGLDEHVWLSLKNAAFFVRKIADVLAEIDSDGKEAYESNAESYIRSLRELDDAYAAAVRSAPRDTILFGDRFPFRYLVRDYDLSYYAAFVGCSAEVNASFETIAFLSNKVNELGLKVILKLENSKSDIAESIKNNSAAKNQTILVLDSLQSANRKEYAAGRNYLSVMEKNLEVLKKALAA